MKYSASYQPDFSRRDPNENVAELFHTRWSPRSFKKVAIPEQTLNTIFDAARWAPSCYNDQPWLFVTSSGDHDFDLFLDLLVDANQAWARNAGLLGFIFARRRFKHNNNANRWAPFDCGAAWMSLVLQASMLGLHCHGMGGIKLDEVHEKLNVPKEDYEAICGFAIGVMDTPDKLAKEIAEREIPSPRKSLGEIWQCGPGKA